MEKRTREETIEVLEQILELAKKSDKAEILDLVCTFEPIERPNSETGNVDHVDSGNSNIKIEVSFYHKENDKSMVFED